MTWLLASKMMRCDAKSAYKCFPVVIIRFMSRLGLLLICFVSYTQVHGVGIMPFIIRSNRQNYAMCAVSPCAYTLKVPLDTVFYSIFINHRFSFGKRTIRTWPSRIYPHLEGFKLALSDTRVVHQMLAGNSISGTYRSNEPPSMMASFHYWFQGPFYAPTIEFIAFPCEN